MAQPVTNIGERQPEADAALPLAPPTDMAARESGCQRTNWALYVLGLLAIGVICYWAEKILVVISVSVLLAFVLAPIADLGSRLRMPRWVGSALAVLLLIGALGGAAYYGVNQLSNLVDQLPKYSGRVRTEVANLSRKEQRIEAITPSQPGAIRVRETQNWTELLSSGFGSATETILAASFIPFLIFFMLTWHEHARAATVGLFRPEDRREAYSTIGQIATMVRSFILGNLLIGLIMGGISTAVFGLLGIPFFYFVGLAAGFFSLIPYLGVILAVLPPLFVDVGHLTLANALWIVVTVLTLHLIALNVLYPKFLGSRLRLNPLSVTIALLIWGSLWGAIGLLLAVPVTAAMKIVFDHVEPLKPFGAWLGVESR
jgi:predicted PurR-regulated permease PerM